MKIPAQLSVAALVLLLYYWPWSLSSGYEPADVLMTVLPLQILFVIGCKILSSESWCTLVILVEAICMVINSVFMSIETTLFFIHGYIITTAFIMQLLIITISIRGAAVGRANSVRLPLGRHSMGYLRRNSLFSLGNKEACQ